MSQKFDCIIIGGGIVGLTTALALAQKEFQVALVEAGPLTFDYDPEPYDLRVSAITRCSEQIFKNLSVWEDIIAERASSYELMRVWEEQGEGNIEFSAKNLGQSNLGYIVENRVIRKHLFNKIQEHEAVTVFSSCKSEDLYHQDDEIILQLDGANEIKAKLLIGADGARSWLRNRAEFELEEKNYNHHALVATVRTELPHNKVARQRFLTDGILALLPLSEPNTHSIVWSSLPEKAQKLMDMENEEFSEQLTEAFSSLLGKAEVLSPRACFPLFMRHVKNYVKPRIALIGDAAHTVHPLAGQGVNLGLLDAASLVGVLVKTRAAERDFGLMQNLRKYERARKGDNQIMLLAMAGFKNLFGKETSSIVWARNLGLNLTDKAEPVKTLFMKKAMGLMGALPSLAKPI